MNPHLNEDYLDSLCYNTGITTFAYIVFSHTAKEITTLELGFVKLEISDLIYSRVVYFKKKKEEVLCLSAIKY